MDNNRKLHLPPFTILKTGSSYLIQRGLVFIVETGERFEVEDLDLDLRYEEGNKFDIDDQEYVFVKIVSDNRSQLEWQEIAEIQEVTILISSIDLADSSSYLIKYKQLGKIDGDKIIQKIKSDIYVSMAGTILQSSE
jgi:hypothetical protein